MEKEKSGGGRGKENKKKRNIGVVSDQERMGEDNSPETLLGHLRYTREVLHEILYDLLPARGESLENLQEKSARLAQHADGFYEETEEKTEPLALRVLARKVRRKTVSLVKAFFWQIWGLICTCCVYLRTVCRSATEVPDIIEYDG